MILISSKGRLGFTFTLQEVEVIRASLSRMANGLGSTPGERKMAAPIAVKMLNRLCAAHVKGVLR